MRARLAISEDLKCSYQRGRLSSSLVEGSVQVRVEPHDDDVIDERAATTAAAPTLALTFRDPSRHVQTVRLPLPEEEDVVVTRRVDDDDDDGTRHVYLLRRLSRGRYVTVLRYRCVSRLRPVPIRVQTRVRSENDVCRVALQISSNPANRDELCDLTITMSAPPDVRGDDLVTSPPGGVWNDDRRDVVWRVSELAGGEKFQLQARFGPLPPRGGDDATFFPVQVRCQCRRAQLSDVEVAVDAARAEDVDDEHDNDDEHDDDDDDDHHHEPPVYDVRTTLARRFRLAHREKP